MKLLKLLAAALFALMPTAAIAAQATYTMPTTGPLSMSSYSADVNSALAAILSKNSGSSAPSVTGQPLAFQWWVDTSGTPRVLKLYDGANWLTVGTIDTTGHLWGANASTLTLLGSSSGSTVVQPTAAASGTLTLPAATDTLVGKATTDTLTNKTYDTAGAGNSFKINGLAATANTGTGSVVRATSPALTTPDLGTPSAVTLTNATGLPVGSGISGLASGIAAWLATPTSANLATALTDETGSGLAVFATSPSLTTPTLGVASATTVNKVTITAPATGSTLTIPNGVTLTGPASSGTAMTLGNAETVTGAKSFNSSDFILNGSSSGSTTVNAAAAASGTLTLPAATDTLVGKATTDTLTNKTFDTAGTGNSFSINGVAATANTGTGAVARAAGPTFTTPTLGAATATTLNKVTVTQPATGSTLTIADGKTATVNNSLTLAGTDSTTMTFPSTSATIARTDAANTFTGVQTFSTPIALGSGGSGQGTAAAARASSGFNIDEATTHGDSNYTILSTDRSVLTTTTFTAPRTWALPAANSVNPGQELDVRDAAGAINGANTLTIARADSDTINGSTSTVISAQYDGRTLKSDGVSTWHFIPGGSGGGSGTVTSVATNSGLTGGTITTSGTIGIASNGVTNALSAQMSAHTWKGNSTGSTANAADNAFGTGVDTFLGTPSSANLAAALTNETGTAGSAVFSVSPALTGSPTAPTQTAGDNSTNIATTAYVDATKPTLGTPVASTSGTSIDFTGIPSTATVVKINFAGVSTTGTSVPIIQIGDSGGIETTGYLGSTSGVFSGATTVNSTIGCQIDQSTTAAALYDGTVTISLQNASTNTWVFSGSMGRSDSAQLGVFGYSKALSPGPLDRVRITTITGTPTFDAGSINISYQ